jgi:transcriptional regulator with XRE-family HTH domain
VKNKMNNTRQVAAIGVRARDARIKAKMSQRQVAAKSGLDPVVISRLERGKHMPTITTLTRLAKAIGCEVTVFIR